MSGLGGLRGVSAGQDARFSDKQKKQLRDLEAKGVVPKELNLKVDFNKVNWPVMKEWIAKRVTELLGGLEEEVLIGMVFNLLEDREMTGKILYVQLLPFLEKNTSLFCKELWTMLLSANQTPSMVPQQLLDAEAEKQRVLRAQHEAYQAQLLLQRQAQEAALARIREEQAAQQKAKQEQEAAAAAAAAEKERERERERAERAERPRGERRGWEPRSDRDAGGEASGTASRGERGRGERRGWEPRDLPASTRRERRGWEPRSVDGGGGERSRDGTERERGSRWGERDRDYDRDRDRDRERGGEYERRRDDASGRERERSGREGRWSSPPRRRSRSRSPERVGDRMRAQGKRSRSNSREPEGSPQRKLASPPPPEEGSPDHGRADSPSHEPDGGRDSKDAVEDAARQEVKRDRKERKDKKHKKEKKKHRKEKRERRSDSDQEPDGDGDAGRRPYADGGAQRDAGPARSGSGSEGGGARSGSEDDEELAALRAKALQSARSL